MAEQAHILGVDFGTSNSAAGYLADGQPRLVEMSPGQTGLPTAFFFDFDTRKTLLGDAAVQALLDGAEGRFMRALKRVLGTPLMHEPRMILNERVTFVEIVARFLRHIRTQAEAEAGRPFTHVLSGRPVVFHGAGDPREVQAEHDLRQCYHTAGFDHVAFLPEPEAAALASGATAQGGGIGLVVDIGGGTSDFSVFAPGPDGVRILANHGIRIGGTDFDRAISIDRVMPLFGRGTRLRDAMGPGVTTAPKALFNDLATWEKIPFLYTARHRRDVDEMARVAEAPAAFARLRAVLRDELGHDVAFAVETGKIDANGGTADAAIRLDEVERGLHAALPPAALSEILASFARDLDAGAQETLRLAGLRANRIDHVVYVGGSSLMGLVSDAMTVRFPAADHVFSDVLTAVTRGLALATARP